MPGRFRFASIACVLLVLISGCPFMGMAYQEDLIDEYAVWATDAIEDAAIVYKDKDDSGALVVVPAAVFAYGWDDHFIVAKQHPPDAKDSFKVDANTTYWYLIEVESRKVHGPLSEDEFRDLRNELKVPTELSFTKTLP